MVTHRETALSYRPEAVTDNPELLQRYRETLPEAVRDVSALDHPDSGPAAAAAVAGYRSMTDGAADPLLTEVVLWEVVGIPPEKNTDYARDAVGLLAGYGVAQGPLSRPPGERLHYTAMRAGQYREIKAAGPEAGAAYAESRLEQLACQHNRACHLVEAGMIGRAGYYAMGLALAAVSPLTYSLSHFPPRDGAAEELLAILVELDMLGTLQSALANDLRHYLQQRRDSESRVARLGELALRNEGLGAALRRNLPLPECDGETPATAQAQLTLMAERALRQDGPQELRTPLLQRLNERAQCLPESAPRQLAVARALS